MKKITYLLLTIFFSVYSLISTAKIHTITVSNNIFTPSSISNVVVGDTIRWIWAAGFHTTTSANVPNGADTWSKSLTTNGDQFDYKVLIPGNYKYYCQVHASASSTSGMIGTFTASTVNGIGAKEISSSGYSLYPNPVHENLFMNFNSDKNANGDMRITDITGKELQTYPINIQAGQNKYNFPFTQLYPGIYFIEIFKEGKRIGVERVLKN